MPATCAAERGARLGSALDALLPAEPELAYANFAALAQRPGAAEALHRERFCEEGDDVLAVLVARDEKDRPLAVLRLEGRPFESEHFGLAMARIEAPLAVPDDERRLPALRGLYRAALERLGAEGYAHVAALASTRDRAAGWSLQELGGFQVDTRVSWMAALSGTPHDDPLPPPLRLEILEGAQIRRLDPASWKRLAEWTSTAFDRGPFVFDLDLPRRRSQAVYQAWTARAMGGEWADALLVARDGEEIVAFISMLRIEDLSRAAGAPVCGRGLGATLPEYRGLFTALQREMIAARPLGAAFMENETQVATLGSINVYAKLGFRYLRSTASFHLRLDAPRRRAAPPRPCG